MISKKTTNLIADFAIETAKFSSLGGIDDVYSVFNKFFSTDFGSDDDVDALNEAGISDDDTSGFDSIDFSVYPKTLEITKSVEFSVMTIPLKFSFSERSFSWIPILNNGIETMEDAMKNLSGLTYSRSVSMSKTLDEMKTLALNEYSDESVMNLVNDSTTKEEFISGMNDLGLSLMETVNVYDEMNEILSMDPSYSLDSSSNDDYVTDPCSSVETMPYDSDTINSVQDDCCGDAKDETKESDYDYSGYVQESVDEDSMESALDDLLSSLNEANDDMNECADEKQNAINSLYFYMESLFLNEMALKYTMYRSILFDSLTGSTSTVDSEILRKNSMISVLEAEISESDDDDEKEILSKRKVNIENEISTLESLKTTISVNVEVPSLSSDVLVSIASVDVSDISSFLYSNLTSFRSIFSLNNVVTNQVGFDGQKLKMKVDSSIKSELSTMFSMVYYNSNDMSSFIEEMTDERDGLVAFSVWNKYYDQGRIDNLFTYLEQGYLSPKPEYDSSGNLVGTTTQSVLTSSSGEVTQEVSSEMGSLDVDSDVANDFWSNLEMNVYDRINLLLDDLKNSDSYLDFISSIMIAAKNEAAYAYSLGIALNATGILKDEFDESYESCSGFDDAIREKIYELQTFIDEKNLCIAEGEEKMKKSASTFSSTVGNSGSAGVDRNDCSSKLGSDPFGIGIPGDCPGITKECYWTEYTKIMQMVSLMPIPDVENLTKRFFRYYPIGIQTPVPIPPGTLPTMASGMVDSMISIPFPIIWKHIMTVYCPLGLFVMWIGLCGPIPGPYVMYVDENEDPCFLMTPKGSVSIPANSLNISDDDKKSLIETLSSIKDVFRVSTKTFPFNLLYGDSNIDVSDSDSSSNIIKKISDKIKKGIDFIDDSKSMDYFSITGTDEEKRKKKKMLKRMKSCFDKECCDIDAIEFALDGMKTTIDSLIDEMKMTSIKFPKDPRKLITPLLGPMEFIDSINDLIDSGIDPTELGLSSKTVNLRDKMKMLMDDAFYSESMKKTIKKFDDDVRIMENSFSFSMNMNFKKEKRNDAIKKFISSLFDSISDSISPEFLGYVFALENISFASYDCYDSEEKNSCSADMFILMEMIKEFLSTIADTMDSSLLSELEKFIDLSKPLPGMESMFFFIEQSILDFVPDFEYIESTSATMNSMVLKSSLQNVFKMKIRMPNPGVVQLEITSDMIKSPLKSIIDDFFEDSIASFLNKLKNGIFKTSYDVSVELFSMLGFDIRYMIISDIKMFISSKLDSIEDKMQDIENFISGIDISPMDIDSIKKKIFSSGVLKTFDKGPFVEIGTTQMKSVVDILLETLKVLNIPFPLVLMACSSGASRAVITKVHPYRAFTMFPPWEGLSTQNIPFLVWLDQLIATAQRQGGIGSDCVSPYFSVDV